MKRERTADEKRDARQWERFQRRLEQQKVEANRARNGRMGAASGGRRLDPVTGEVIEVLAKRSVPFVRPKAAKSEHGDERALAVLRRAGRDGAPAAWLADTATMGEAKALSLLRRGLAVATRSNRFMLAKWADKAVPPLVVWDERRKDADGRRIGMVEPPPLPPQPATRLTTVRTTKDEEPDPNLRMLQFKKSNYGPISQSVALRWENGVYKLVPGVSSLNKLAAQQQVEAREIARMRRATP